MPLTVATTCPSCGGGLEFPHGSNAVHCSYCGSDLFVTGRGRVMSYWLPDRLPADRAADQALATLRKSSGPGWSVREATLFFVPFHHFTAQSLCWASQEVTVGSASTAGSRPGIGGLLGMTLDEALGGDELPSRRELTEQRYDLASRCIDRTFPAVDTTNLGIASLGLKPEVLKLSLFEERSVSERGMIVPATVGADGQTSRTFGPAAGGEAVAEGVFGKCAAMIYYPLWVVEACRPVAAGGTETVLAVVDAVSGDVCNAAAPPATLDLLVAGNGREHETVGLRPLKCPNCAAGLPVRPDDVVFFCAECRRAWYINGTEFTEVPYSIVPPRRGPPADMEYFPFWSVECQLRAGDRVVATKHDLEQLAPGMTLPGEEDREVPLRFFVPAFRIRDPRLLARLAQGFTRQQPVWEQETDRPASSRGCYLSPEDALLVAPIVLFALVPKGNRKAISFAREAAVEPLRAELVLFPFTRGGYDHVDGLFGFSLPRTALRD